jgi:hypothetical protein
MDSLTYVLWGLFDLWVHTPIAAADYRSERPILSTYAIDILLRRLIATLAPTQIAQFAQAGDTYTGARPHSPTLDNNIEAARALLHTAEILLRAAQIDPVALRGIERVVSDLLFLRTASADSAFTNVTLLIEMPAIFDYMRELRFQSAQQHEQIAIIGFFDTATMKVDPFSRPSILQYIDVTYQQNTPDVTLDLRQLQSRRGDEAARMTPKRTQNPLPHDDVFIYKHFDNQVQLRIETRLHNKSVFEFGAIHIHLATHEHIELISTSLIESSNSKSRPLTSRYIRVYRNQSVT